MTHDIGNSPPLARLRRGKVVTAGLAVMRSSDSPHAASPTALVAGTTASNNEACERVGATIKPVPDALLILVRELARQAAVDAWRAADGASSPSDKEARS